MVWGGICFNARTELIFVDGRLDSDRYVSEICEPVIRPFMPVIGKKFRLMHDNARPHEAKKSLEYLHAEGIRRMKWPAMSPDINPIEHLWDELKRRLRNGDHQPQSIEELKLRIQQEWDSLPQNCIQKLIQSMPSRLAAIIHARGGATRY